MARLNAELGLVFSREFPTREWEEAYFSRFNNWIQQRGENEQLLPKLKESFSKLEEENYQLFRAQQITPKVYGLLLTITHFFGLCLSSKHTAPAKERNLVHMFAHLVETSLTKEQEEQWKRASRSNYHKPEMRSLPLLLMIDLVRFKWTEIARELVKFVYLGYQSKLEELINNSLNEESWGWNALELVPYVDMFQEMPLRGGQKGRPLPFLSKKEIVFFEDEQKKLEELFAHLYVVFLHLPDDNINLVNYFNKTRTELLEIKATKGRIEAKKELIMLHRNRLSIPTYFFNELMAEL